MLLTRGRQQKLSLSTCKFLQILKVLYGDILLLTRICNDFSYNDFNLTLSFCAVYNKICNACISKTIVPVKTSRLSRQHNNANIIALGSRLTKEKIALKCVEIFLKTSFNGGRHIRRVKKI